MKKGGTMLITGEGSVPNRGRRARTKKKYDLIFAAKVHQKKHASSLRKRTPSGAGDRRRGEGPAYTLSGIECGGGDRQFVLRKKRIRAQEEFAFWEAGGNVLAGVSATAVFFGIIQGKEKKILRKERLPVLGEEIVWNWRYKRDPGEEDLLALWPVKKKEPSNPAEGFIRRRGRDIAGKGGGAPSLSKQFIEKM